MSQFRTILPPNIAHHAAMCLQIYEQICKNLRLSREQEDASRLSLRAMELEPLSPAEREVKLQEHRMIDQQVRDFRFQQDLEEGRKLFYAAISCLEVMVVGSSTPEGSGASQAQGQQDVNSKQAEVKVGAPEDGKGIIHMANVPAGDTIVKYHDEWYILKCVLCGHQHASAASLYSHVNQGDKQHVALLGGIKKHSQAVEASGTLVIGVTNEVAVAHNNRARELQQQARDAILKATSKTYGQKNKEQI